MVWLVQNCRSIKCLQFLKPPELRGGGACPPGPPTRALPTTRWGTLSGPQTPRLLTPPLTTNPGSTPADQQCIFKKKLKNHLCIHFITTKI